MPFFNYVQDVLYVAGAGMRRSDDGQDVLYVAGAGRRRSDDGQDVQQIIAPEKSAFPPSMAVVCCG